MAASEHLREFPKSLNFLSRRKELEAAKKDFSGFHKIILPKISKTCPTRNFLCDDLGFFPISFQKN